MIVIVRFASMRPAVEFLVRMGVRVPVGVRVGHVAVAVLVIVGVHVLVRMSMHVATPLGMSWITGHAGPSGR